MPQKLGKGGAGLQNYNPEDGQYCEGGTSFEKFKKPKEYKVYWEKNGDYSHAISRVEYERLKEEGATNLSETKATVKDNWYEDEKDIVLTEEEEKLVNEALDEVEINGNKGISNAMLKFQSKISYKLNFKTQNARYFIASRIADAYYEEILDKWQKARDEIIKKGKEYLENHYNKIKGEHTPTEDLIQVNKSNYNKYKYGTPEYNAFANNCQRCVQVYFLRRLGYDVEASGRYIDEKEDEELDAAGWSKAIFIEPKYGFEVFDNTKLGTAVKTQLKNINDIVSKQKDGAMYLCRIKYYGSKDRHVFIVEKQNGQVRFVDPQIGSEDASHFFGKNYFTGRSKIEAKQTQLIRIDNLDTNENVRLVARNK